MDRITKVRGICVGGNVAEEMNPDVMFAFIQALREGNLESKAIPQFYMRINNVTREITSKTMSKIYSNAANTKRWLNPNKDRSRLFAFGMTKYPL